MKNYKEFKKEYIGNSDIASLVLRAPMKLQELYFGEDASYYAYICDEICEIGNHYELVFECKHWLKIYDDTEMTKEFNGKEIKVYKAGNFGIIIQIIKE